MLSERIIDEWCKAIARLGGIEVFESQVLPFCSESAKLAWSCVREAVIAQQKE